MSPPWSPPPPLPEQPSGAAVHAFGLPADRRLLLGRTSAPRKPSLLFKSCAQVAAVGKYLEAFFADKIWWVGRIIEMNGEDLRVAWFSPRRSAASWINSSGEIGAPDGEELVRILGEKKPQI